MILDSGQKIDYKLSFAIAGVIVYLYLVNLMAYILPENMSSEVSVVLKVLLAAVYAFAIPSVIKRFKWPYIWFILIAIVIGCLNLLFFSSSEITLYIQDIYVNFFVLCLPTAFLVTSVRNKEILMKFLLNTSMILGLVCIITLVFQIFGVIVRINSSEYSMGYGYACLLPSIILFGESIAKRKIKYFISFIFLFLAIISVGSRGPLIGLLIYVVVATGVYLIKGKHTILFVIITFLLTVFTVFFDTIINIIINTLLSFGIQSRTILLIQSGMIGKASGRNQIYDIIIESINQNFLQVRGIGSDRLLIGVYAHNIALELLYQLGGLIGCLILLFLLIMVVKTIIKFISNPNTSNNIEFILLCVSIPQLMVSSSVWIHYWFWAWLISSIVNLKNKRYPVIEADREEIASKS